MSKIIWVWVYEYAYMSMSIWVWIDKYEYMNISVGVYEYECMSGALFNYFYWSSHEKPSGSWTL